MRGWAAFAALVIAVAGCGGGGGGGSKGSSSGSSTGSTATGSFEVVRAEPTHGAQLAAPATARITFNRTVNPATVVFNAASAAQSTIVFVEQPAGASAARLFAGQVAAAGGQVTYTPSTPFVVGNTYAVGITDRVQDAGGAPLATGTVSGPRTLNVTGLVFQATFTVTAATGGSTGGSTGTVTAPDALVTPFVAEAGSDVWHLDFAAYGTFDQDLSDRRLASGEATVDAWARRRVQRTIFSYTGVKYLRNASGTGISGQSYAISFVWAKPSGTAGQSYNRHCLGGDGGGTLGVSIYDPGNRGTEDNGPRGGLGVFTSSIDGVDSTLSTRLRTTELRFVDGTYRLGQGTATEDARFTVIDEALTDYGRAIGIVLAHEVGHSVGLDHDNAGSTSIMSAALSSNMLSNVSMRFSSTSLNRLNSNLGFSR